MVLGVDVNCLFVLLSLMSHIVCICTVLLEQINDDDDDDDDDMFAVDDD